MEGPLAWRAKTDDTVAVPALLIETSGDHQGRSHELEPGATVTIGRSPENSIVLQNAIASRRHARIWDENGTFMVEDLGTKNGTLRNGKALTSPERLEDGDEVAVPGLTLRFQTMDATVTITIGSAGPSATKTFLFADLRGFTAYTEQHGDAAASEMVTEYRRIVRAEIARTRGTEVKTEGDSFFVVFDSARQAVECALGIQRAATDHTAQRPELPVRVGIGLHAGEPIVERGDYLGLAVNIASRLASNAQAGEVLISDVIRGLVPPTAMPPATLREGLTLKGIDDPPRVYAIAAPTPAAPSSPPAA